MTTPSSSLQAVQQQVWDGALPLEIRLSPLDCRTYDVSPSYFVSRVGANLLEYPAC